MKYTKFLFMALLVIGLSSCQKEEILKDEAHTENIQTRKFIPPCNDPDSTDLEGLADIGGCYNPEWSGGELEEYINGCLIGDIALCQDFNGFEIVSNVSSNPFFPGDYDLDFDGVFSAQEQLAMIDDIMDIVEDLQPSCSSATLVSVDVYRDALINVAAWVCVKYMCCGKSKVQ